MNITERSERGFCVIQLTGKVDAANIPDFERKILEILDRGETRLVFNCQGLKYISSTGLRVFLVAQKRLSAVRGKIYLCGLEGPVLQTVAFAGFQTLFRIFETEEEALGN